MTLDATATPGAVLTAVADLLERQGWHQGGPYHATAVTGDRPPAECPLCVLAAIAVVLGLQPDIWTNSRMLLIDERPRFTLAVESAELLAAHLGISAFTAQLAAPPGLADLWDAAEYLDIEVGGGWNDTDGRTADEVLTALRTAGRPE